MAKASAKRLVSLQDYYRLESVGSPAISPDGQQVAFVRTRILEEENCSHSEIWLVPADGSREPVRVTSPAFDASSPRWSPDGKLLSFSSSRKLPGTKDQKPNPIWFLRMDVPMGEAFQIEGVVGSPIFSPDNQWIAFTKPTPPSPKPEKMYGSDFERKTNERFDGRVYDWMNYRFDRRGYLPDPRDPNATPPEELYIISREGGVPRQLTRLGFNVQEPEWRSDGSALVFTADSHQRDEYTYERSDLWTVDTNGGIRRLTDGEYNYSGPAWSPDGRRIVMRGNQGLDVVIRSKQSYGSPTDLFVVTADGGSPENITKDWDLIPGAPQWSPDGKHIYFSAGIGGNTHLFRVPASGGRVEQITHGDRWLSGFSFSSDFKCMTYHASDPTHPGDIFSARIDGSSEKQLTRSNKNLLDEIEFSPAERILYKSRDGTEIEGWIMQPQGYDPEKGLCPMILTIHGGPHSAYGNDFSFNRQLYAANGYIVLYTNPRGSTGYGEKFHWATWGGWGILDYEDLMAGVDYALKHYPIDSKRLGVTGRSYGGFMTNWINGHTDRFAAAVAGASISNWVSDYGVADIARTKESEFYGTPWEQKSRDLMIKLSPITYAGNARTPTLFVQGEQDYRAPIEEAEHMYFALKKLRVPAKFIRLPESSHGNWTPWRTVYSLYEEMKWWEKHLQSRPSSDQ